MVWERSGEGGLAGSDGAWPGPRITRRYEDVVEDVTDRVRDPRGRWGEMRPKNRPSARTLTGRCGKHREPLAGFVGRLLRSGSAGSSLPICEGRLHNFVCRRDLVWVGC